MIDLVLVKKAVHYVQDVGAVRGMGRSFRSSYYVKLGCWVCGLILSLPEMN